MIYKLGNSKKEIRPMFFTPQKYFHTAFNLINEILLACGYCINDTGHSECLVIFIIVAGKTFSLIFHFYLVEISSQHEDLLFYIQLQLLGFFAFVRSEIFSAEESCQK